MGSIVCMPLICYMRNCKNTYNSSSVYCCIQVGIIAGKYLAASNTLIEHIDNTTCAHSMANCYDFMN